MSDDVGATARALLGQAEAAGQLLSILGDAIVGGRQAVALPEIFGACLAQNPTGALHFVGGRTFWNRKHAARRMAWVNAKQPSLQIVSSSLTDATTTRATKPFGSARTAGNYDTDVEET
jgi:hypothetical protein